MNRDTLIKLIAGISVISLSVVTILFISGDSKWIAYASIVANTIQIITFSVWFFEKDVTTKKVEDIEKDVKAIRSHRDQDITKNKEKEELIRRLVNEGLIPEKELYSLIKKQELICVYSYGEGLIQTIKELTDDKEQPLIGILKKMGFIRTFPGHNLFVLFERDLKSLRNIDNLEKFIKKTLPMKWKIIQQRTKEAYPKTRYPIHYEKWRTGRGFKVSYLIWKMPAYEFIIGYMREHSFSDSFRTAIWRYVDHKKLREIIEHKKHKIKAFITRISIEILLKDVLPIVRRGIVDNEKKIKKRFDIKIFTDYRLLKNRISELGDELSKYLPKSEIPNVEEYSKLIVVESEKFDKILREIGAI